MRNSLKLDDYSDAVWPRHPIQTMGQLHRIKQYRSIVRQDNLRRLAVASLEYPLAFSLSASFEVWWQNLTSRSVFGRILTFFAENPNIYLPKVMTLICRLLCTLPCRFQLVNLKYIKCSTWCTLFTRLDKSFIVFYY